MNKPIESINNKEVYQVALTKEAHKKLTVLAKNNYRSMKQQASYIILTHDQAFRD